MKPQPNIVKYPDPILAKKSEGVRDIGKAELKLIKNMIVLMHEHRGVGIAAPQIGVSKRIFVICPSSKPGDEVIFINPKISGTNGLEAGVEGCLSLPNISGEIWRSTELQYEALDIEGKLFQGTAVDFTARVIQHELDHLDGKLIIDRVDFDKRQKLLRDYQCL